MFPRKSGPAPLRVEASGSLGGALWLVRDAAVLAWLAVCVAAMPFFAWSFWILVATGRKALGIPGLPAPSTGVVLGMMASWSWMALGFAACEDWVVRRVARRAGEDAFAVRLRPRDRRLRAPHDTGVVRLGRDAIEFRGVRWDVWIGREDIRRAGGEIALRRGLSGVSSDTIRVPVRTPDSQVDLLLNDGARLAEDLRLWLDSDRHSESSAVDKGCGAG